MSKQAYFPERGDIVHMSMDPSAGRELAGPHFALVLSPQIYNKKQGLLVAVPLTSKYHGNPFQLELPKGLTAAGGKILGGWVYADQVKSFDWRERNAVFVCSAPTDFVEQVLDLTLTLLDPSLA